MADEGDLAQELNEEFFGDVMRRHQRERAESLKVVRMCEECEEKPTFITPQGTRTRICKGCWEEKKAAKTAAA